MKNLKHREKNEKFLNAVGNISDELILEAAPQSTPLAEKPRRPRLRLAVALAAAVLLLTLTVGAGASMGGLIDLPNVFAPMFHYPKSDSMNLDMELIERMGHPVGASAVDNGVTVRVESVLRDKYVCRLLLSIHKEGLDGNSLNIESARVGGCLENCKGGSYGITDVVEGDNAVQCYMEWDSSEGFPDGIGSVEISEIVLNHRQFLREVRLKGNWTIEFDTSYEDTSVSLPAGQELELYGIPIVLDEITVSPISIMVKYSVTAEPPFDRDTIERSMDAIQIKLRLKTGEIIPLASSLTGPLYSSERETGEEVDYTRLTERYSVGEYDRLLDLDEVEAVIIEDTEIPVN